MDYHASILVLDVWLMNQFLIQVNFKSKGLKFHFPTSFYIFSEDDTELILDVNAEKSSDVSSTILPVVETNQSRGEVLKKEFKYSSITAITSTGVVGEETLPPIPISTVTIPK
ncbi:hypothetical protein ACTA71_005443 [Dictyostelium dimigraforme]